MSNAGNGKKKNRWWLIHVAGYGSFLWNGTEREAEKMRMHKSHWEGGVGWKFFCGSKEKAELAQREARNLEEPISKSELEAIVNELTKGT